MKIIINEKLIKTRRTIGQVTTVVALVTLGVGLVISFKAENDQTDLLTYSFLCLIIGFILSQIGIYFGSRWGRSPRPDETITQSLKGLESKYSLYHYTSPVSHLLVGPAGIWVLVPYFQGGTITYNTDRSKWQQKGGNVFLKFFAQDSLGRPEQDVESSQKNIEKFLTKTLPSQKFPAIKSVLVFTNEKATVDANNAPIPTLHTSKLKEFFRKQAKQEPVPLEVIKEIQDALPQSLEDEK